MMISVTNYNPLFEIIRYYVAAIMQHLGVLPVFKMPSLLLFGFRSDGSCPFSHQPSPLVPVPASYQRGPPGLRRGVSSEGGLPRVRPVRLRPCGLGLGGGGRMGGWGEPPSTAPLGSLFAHPAHSSSSSSSSSPSDSEAQGRIWR